MDGFDELIEEAGTSAEDGPCSVSDAVAIAKIAIEALPSLDVTGEISGWHGPNRTGHVYFSLKDELSSMDVIIWKSAFNALDPELAQALRDGLAVQVRGRFQVYDRSGKLSFVIHRIQIAGEGLLRQKVAELAKKLEAEGLMDPDAKNKVPAFCERIAVVTSPTGAVIEDVKRTLARRNPLVEILLSPCAVQGDGAAATVIEAIHRAVAAAPDCILVVRGGGSYEDLMCFNDEALAREIAACPIPIVTGIGHEPDTTIADMVADRRASTPTAAAESIAPSIDVLASTNAERSRRMDAVMRQILDNAEQMGRDAASSATRSLTALIARERQALEVLARNRVLSNPRAQIDSRIESLLMSEERLTSALPRLVDARFKAVSGLSERLALGAGRIMRPHAAGTEALASQLSALSPYGVLSRGYAIVRDAEGHVVSKADAASVGDTISVLLASGSLEAAVEQVHPDSEA